MAVDSKGRPAITEYGKPYHIFYQWKDQVWDEIKACSYAIDFGQGDKLYRLGCDDFVYQTKDFDLWEKLGKRKAYMMSATSDAVWILDKISRLPYVFDQKS